MRCQLILTQENVELLEDQVQRLEEVVRDLRRTVGGTLIDIGDAGLLTMKAMRHLDRKLRASRETVRIEISCGSAKKRIIVKG